MIVDYFPDGAAFGSQVRIVGSGFTGATSVTIGGISVAFTVTGDTDLTFRLPATGRGMTLSSNYAQLTVDGTDLVEILVGYPGPWVTPSATIPVSMPSTTDGVYTGLGGSFSTAITGLMFFGYTPDIPTNVALIGPDEDSLVAPLHNTHSGLWQSSQRLDAWQIAPYLLNSLPLFGPFDYPTDAIGSVYDFPADLMHGVGTVSLAYTWQPAVYPVAPGGHYGPTGLGSDETVEIRLLNDFADPPTSPSSPGSLPLIASDVLPAATGGDVSVDTLLEDVGFGAHYTGKGIGTAAVTAYQSSGSEPSWPDFGSGKQGYVAVDFIASLTFDWQPPRWRPLYAKSPVTRLRQSPRDDYLGGTPRQGKTSRSVQSSARQGWTNAYR